MAKVNQTLGHDMNDHPLAFDFAANEDGHAMTRCFTITFKY